MRRIHGILLGMFAGGVLLGGIGTGIAFGEYSGMEYGGNVLLGEEHLVTRNLDYVFSLEEGERIRLNPCPWGDRREGVRLIEDETVPAGTVRYEVTYNERELAAELFSWETEEEEHVTILELQFYSLTDDFERVMEYKDHVLEDLKQGQISSYEIAQVEAVTVRVNPQTAACLENRLE